MLVTIKKLLLTSKMFWGDGFVGCKKKKTSKSLFMAWINYGEVTMYVIIFVEMHRLFLGIFWS